MRGDRWTMRVVGDAVVVTRGDRSVRTIPLSEIVGVDTDGVWVRILRSNNDDWSYSHDLSKDRNAVRRRSAQEAEALAAEIRSAANVASDAPRPQMTRIPKTESLLTLDGAIVIDRDAGTVHLGSAGGPLSGAVAAVQTAGAIRTRLSATRVVAVGVLALALRKKVDERELYLTVDAPTFQFVAKVDPRRGDDARKFAARISSLGKR